MIRGRRGPLVQAMAGFGGGPADSSNAALIGADTSQQTLLTPHADPKIIYLTSTDGAKPRPNVVEV
jgi:hypothetical protein